MHISITTELLGEHPPLLDIEIPEIGDDALTSWVRGGDGLIGFGIYKSHVVKGANRFEQARQWWRNEVNGLDIHNNVHGTGTGPILFTSFAFDEAEDSVLIIPKVSSDTQWKILDYLDRRNAPTCTSSHFSNSSAADYCLERQQRRCVARPRRKIG